MHYTPMELDQMSPITIINDFEMWRIEDESKKAKEEIQKEVSESQPQLSKS